MSPGAPGVVAVDGAAVRRRVHRRLLPPLFLLSLFCQLDRANLSFAALQMATDLPFFSRTIQGLGSGEWRSLAWTNGALQTAGPGSMRMGVKGSVLAQATQC